MKTIKFQSVHGVNLEFEKPVPAKDMLPDWYKNASPYHTTDKLNYFLEEEPFGGNLTFKKCFPFLDSLTAGYIINLHADTAFQYTKDDFQNVTWMSSFMTVEGFQEETYDGYPLTPEWSPKLYKWMAQWAIKTPPGYSCLFTHPRAYPDLPFKIVDAVVDTDKIHNLINIPFFLKKDFEGIIRAGTPIVQVIPFKRESWNHKIESISEDEMLKRTEKLFKFMHGSYLKQFRSNKHYR
jgi:hypothetical protein